MAAPLSGAVYWPAVVRSGYRAPSWDGHRAVATTRRHAAEGDPKGMFVVRAPAHGYILAVRSEASCPNRGFTTISSTVTESFSPARGNALNASRSTSTDLGAFHPTTPVRAGDFTSYAPAPASPASPRPCSALGQVKTIPRGSRHTRSYRTPPRFR
jgi:hypothetical protein